MYSYVHSKNMSNKTNNIIPKGLNRVPLAAGKEVHFCFVPVVILHFL